MLGNIHCDFTDSSFIDELREQVKNKTLTGVSSGGTHAVIHYDTKKKTPQTKEVEWVNGLPPVGVECEWIGGGLNHGDWGLVIVHAYNGEQAWIEKLHDNSMYTVRNPAHFRKPETEAERKEREELEAAYQLQLKCAIACGVSFETFKENNDVAEFWKSIVKETGYRVEK